MAENGSLKAIGQRPCRDDDYYQRERGTQGQYGGMEAWRAAGGAGRVLEGARRTSEGAGRVSDGAGWASEEGAQK